MNKASASFRAAAFALPVLLAACGGSPGDRVYGKCMAAAEESIKEASAHLGANGDSNELAQTVRTMAEASCEAMRQVCQSDPDGEICTEALASLGD